MGLELELLEHDRRFYEERIHGFLPARIVDIHTHVWRAADYPGGRQLDPRTVSWPLRVAADNPIEDLLETYRLMLPGQRVTPLIFPNLPEGGNLDAINAYTARAAREARVPALVFSDPAWSAAELERRIDEGGFLGIKSYLTLAPAHIARKDICLYDYFPKHQLAVLDRRGWIMMLHLPRDGRLRDPLNLAQMLEIDERFPGVRVVVAHVGRAYCDHDVGNAFEVLAKSQRLCFDLSANTNARVFEALIRGVGPKRILYGTDLPVERMRMRRIERDGRYVNLVPKGLYGDVSGDPNMGEVEGREAEALTFFLYEEIDAFRRAAEATGLSRTDLEDVFCGNAERMLAGARGGGT